MDVVRSAIFYCSFPNPSDFMQFVLAKMGLFEDHLPLCLARKVPAVSIEFASVFHNRCFAVTVSLALRSSSSLTIVITQVLNNGIFPDKLKIAKVVPIIFQKRRQRTNQQLPTDLTITCDI